MTEWVTPGMLDWILVGVGLEFFALRTWLITRGEKEWAGPLFFFLISGALLMASVRMALSGASTRVLAILLGFSFLTHILFFVRVKDLIFPVRGESTGRDQELL